MDMHDDPQYKTADGSALRIWRDTAKNNFLSERDGRPVFDEVVYAMVISPGSRDSQPVFELVREYNGGYAPTAYGPKYDEYKSFIDDFEKNEAGDASLAGTPLKEWPEMTRSMVAALKQQNIFTVDALAELPDTKLVNVGPDGRTWREKAKAYIENAKSGAHATALAAALEVSNTEKAALQAHVAELAARIDALEAEKGAAKTPGKATTVKDPPTPAPPPPPKTPSPVDPANII